MNASLDGGYLCGDVRYRIRGTPLVSVTCQCRSCRRASGAAIVPWLHLRAEDFSFTAGQPIEFNSSPSVTRTFCGSCGTPLTYWRSEYGAAIDVTTCSLDDPESCSPMAHVWTSHGLGWMTLADDLPRFAEEPPRI